jgi:hypothetical protein
MEFHDHRWKTELNAFAKEIEGSQVFRTSDEDAKFRAERPIMYSAFIVRKLIEDGAVTDSLASRSVDVEAFPSTREGKEIFLKILMGPLNVEDEFDLTSPRNIRVSYYDLSSEIVHADGFFWNLSSEPAESFGVFSYRNVLDRMIVMPIRLYLDVIARVLRDKPERWIQEQNFKTGKITRYVLTERQFVRMKKPQKNNQVNQRVTTADGGSGGIRTHERVTPSLVFKTSAFNHSATLPCRCRGIRSSRPASEQLSRDGRFAVQSSNALRAARQRFRKIWRSPDSATNCGGHSEGRLCIAGWP